MVDWISTIQIVAAQRYFAEPNPAFWQWADDGEVVTTLDGETIAFREELIAVLEPLAPQGLPSFGALLLMLAACRDSFRGLHYLAARVLGVGNDDPQLVGITSCCRRIAGLPRDLRIDSRARAALAQLAFAPTECLEGISATAAVDLLRQGMITPKTLWGNDASEAIANQDRDLRLLVQRLIRLTTLQIEMRLRTGLEEPIEPAEIEVPPAENVRAFVAQLLSDPELAGLGRLTHDLMAAAYIPRAISDPDELPLGGVSDISNRGPLDRLLVSELAHDDLTLAVRIALNEALYLRRESPPRTPVSQRMLLLDAGIRLWGVPRVFAAAVGLALTATADKHAQVTAYRAQGPLLEPVELRTRSGLVSHLEALEPAPHPGAALARFLELAEEADNPIDAVLVTHADVLADAEFRRALTAVVNQPMYLATVDRQGRFRLLQVSRRGQKLIREAQLDLDRLLSPAPQRRTAPLIRKDAGTDLPAILSVDPFPLLLPHPAEFRLVAFSNQHGAVVLTRDRRLMHWEHQGLGAKQLTDQVPPGRALHGSIDDQGTARFVVGDPPRCRMHLLEANLISSESRIMPVPDVVRVPRRIFLLQGALHLVFDGVVLPLLADGTLGQPFNVPRPRPWREGPFFCVGRDWWRLTFDGVKLGMAEVPIPAPLRNRIMVLFDRQGFDGPWAITYDGSIFSMVVGQSRRLIEIDQNCRLVSISHDGRHLLFTHGGRAYWLLSLATGPEQATEVQGAVTVVYGDPRLLVEPDQSRLLQTHNLCNRFSEVLVTRDGRLGLQARGNDVRSVIDWRPAEGGIRLASLPEDEMLRYRIRFTSIPRVPHTGYRLRVAAFHDGSRVYLDSRGLLHLRSSDGSLPQMTFVLNQIGTMAGWCSDGRLWGNSFFTGRETASSAAEVYEDLRKFVERLQ